MLHTNIMAVVHSLSFAIYVCCVLCYFLHLAETKVKCNIPERYINPQNVSVSGGLTVTKEEDPGVEYLNRYRRSTASALTSSTASVQMGCHEDDLTTQCITMQCQIKTFRKDDTVTIKVRMSKRTHRRLVDLYHDSTSSILRTIS